jgi:glutamyl/glutaminyl-tRNA synthetase
LYGSTPRNCWRAGQRYYCFCSREKLETERREALAAGRPRDIREPAAPRLGRVTARIAAGERPAIRFRVPENREVVFADAVSRRGPFSHRRASAIR